MRQSVAGTGFPEVVRLGSCNRRAEDEPQIQARAVGIKILREFQGYERRFVSLACPYPAPGFSPCGPTLVNMLPKSNMAWHVP